MKNTIDLPSSFLRRRGILMRFNLSQRRNLILKFCLKNPNKSETVEHFNWDSRLPLFIVQLKGLRRKNGEKNRFREKMYLFIV
jgi:hypothetical protein